MPAHPGIGTGGRQAAHLDRLPTPGARPVSPLLDRAGPAIMRGMSRAFVKEPDGDQVLDALPERRHSDAPNYITPGGLEALRVRAAALETQRRALAEAPERFGIRGDLQRLESDLRYLNERVQRAIVVEPPEAPRAEVGIGAEVDLIDENDETHRFAIVGEDEVDVGAGRVSWSSPLGRAVLRRRVGDSAIWKRPAGDLEVEVVAVCYPPPPHTSS